MCAGCLHALRTGAMPVACARCGRGRDRSDLSLCWSCRNHLGQALPQYESALRQALDAGFTPYIEARIRELQAHLQLVDADVAHLQWMVLHGRQSPSYVAAWQASCASHAPSQRAASDPVPPSPPAAPPSASQVHRPPVTGEQQRRLAEARSVADRAAQARSRVEHQEADQRRLVEAQRAAERQAEAARERAANGLRFFSRVFHDVVSDGVLHPHEWQLLRSTARDHGLEWGNALAVVRPKAIELLERTIAFAADDGVLTEDEESEILRLCDALQIPANDALVVKQRLFKLKNLLHIRNGGLPLIPDPGIYLESDEACHLRVDAEYIRPSAKRASATPGRLIATTKKLYFSSSSGGGTKIPWKSVLGIERHRGAVLLELSQKSGAGAYRVEDPEVTEAILDTIVRRQKRQLLATNPDGASRRVPHPVRVEVWQRDGGRCVECSATTYLEYDHIIPFSKGGASTVDNVQLLCRRCNSEKADRI